MNILNWVITSFCKCLGGLFFAQSPSTSAEPELMEEHEQPSSSTPRYIQYHIFLSFRGEDTRTTFTDYLYRELQQKDYNVFRDEEGIQCGENIAPALEKAIRESKLSIIVLSENYASSTSCLNELETIMECCREGWHYVVPIFYHVDPHAVRHQEGKFAEHFQEHEKDNNKKQNKVESWKAALREIADLKGIHVEKGKKKEYEIIQETIKDIEEKIEAGLETKAPDLVGQGFQRAKDKILSWLNEDEIVKIGVYGLGGVGKTALIKNIYDEVRISFPICFITVSKDFSRQKLQNLIAKEAKIDISSTDILMRANKLKQGLKRKRMVIVLDDLWNYFDVEEVGIPLWPKGCKLIFTTRSLVICNQMNHGENNIKINPLEDDEAWKLFNEEIKKYDHNIEELAKLITRECAGLPLAIKTMARYMRGVRDPYEWSVVLKELKESKFRNDDDEEESNMFNILRYSYDHLKDLSLQECFLYCSLFPEDFYIYKIELINLLIAGGIIEEEYRQDEVYKGYSMIKKLQNLCLLDICMYDGEETEERVKMHDLMRDMALQILRERSSVMVQSGMQLEELPDVDKWKEDLVTVSLMHNEIGDITSVESPMCPMLSTILLCQNWRLRSINDSFFQHFCELKVLDLSDTGIEALPNSISDLVRLTALLLKGCVNLEHVPWLGKLQELKTLDLCNTRIKQVPQGMELLLKLKYLDMYGCTDIEEFPVDILPNLRKLQFLRLAFVWDEKEKEEEEEKEKKNEFKKEMVSMILKLRHLKYLECRFRDIDSFKRYLHYYQNHKQLHRFKITVFPGAHGDSDDTYSTLDKSPNTVKLITCGDIGREFLPEGTAQLELRLCDCGRSFFPIKNAAELRCIKIAFCDGIECLVSSSSSSSGSSVNVLEDLEELSLVYNKSLQELIRMEDEVPPHLPSYGNAFAHLKNIEIDGCQRMKKLFPQGLLPNLKNLETISVRSCNLMKEIIASEEREETLEEQNLNNSLPKLKSLKLCWLPQLRTISSSLLICESLEEIVVDRCEMLRRITIAPPLPSFKRMIVDSVERDWWEQLEWEHPDVKTILSRQLSIVPRPVWNYPSTSETESPEPEEPQVISGS